MNISVCIPIFNVEKYIVRCARSLFEQTAREDIEFIFVDDCSPDHSVQVLQQLLLQYPHRKDQVKILHHETNKGVAAARKTALYAASGQYIIFCDSDDWVDCDLYKSMYDLAISQNADVVCCDIALERNGRKPILLSTPYKTIDEMFVKHFNSATFNSLCNKMFLRTIAIAADQEIDIREKILIGEDMLYVVMMQLMCQQLAVCNGKYYRYFFSNPHSVTLNISQDTFLSDHRVEKILTQHLPEKYQFLAASLIGQVLFSALSTQSISRKEFFKLYTVKEIFHALLSTRLSLDKRLLILCACICYPFACRLCQVRLWLVKKIRLG